MQILVVHDEPVSRNLLLGLLQADRHHVIAASDVEEAWQLLQHAHFPVVITDGMTPAGGGLELCRRIRRERRSAYSYVILLTAAESCPTFRDGVEAGADDFLPKPVDGDVMRARLRLAERVLGLEREVGRFKGLLPICVYCQKIRDGLGEWRPIDRYLAASTNSNLSHGICPECADQHEPLEVVRR